MTASTTVERSGDPGRLAQDALARGDWSTAHDLLCDGTVEGRSPEDLELLARAAYGAGDLECAITAWEAAHARGVRDGDAAVAARAAAMVAMYLMMDTGLMSPVRGWLHRADRHLADVGEIPATAWVAMTRAYERLMSGDLDAAGTWATRAVEVGTRLDVPEPVAIARIGAARVQILLGRVEEGLAQLEEAAVPILAAELDPLTTGMAWCELICAMQGLAEYDRAEEWTEAMEAWRPGNAIGGIGGRCRVHRAEILRLRGTCAEAEEEALRACRELRPWMRREFGWPLTELGTIRLRRGDLDGAQEAFAAAHEHGWEPQPGMALCHLARGEVDTAAALVADALERPTVVPWKERPPAGGLRRAPLLDAQVQIAVSAGDVPAARRAAHELADVAIVFRSRALGAMAALAGGRLALAAGDPEAAVARCTEAVVAWSEVGAPWETSTARLVLADALRATGQEDRARLELRTARTVFDRIGARGQLAQADAALADQDAVGAPTPRPGPTATGVFRCDGDTRTVTFDGHTVLLHDLKGMRYLARMLAEPGREFHVMDLVAVERGAWPVGPAPAEPDLAVSRAGHAGELLDATAKQAYRRRLAEIEADIEDADAMHDTERASRARADRDYLVGELARAVGLGGRDRRAADDAERARTSVARVLRYALARIAEHHPALAAHLDHAVRTGTWCAYVPDPRTPITWQT